MFTTLVLIICPQEVHFFNASELVRAMRGLSPTTENEELALSSFLRKEEEEQRKVLIINSFRGARKFISKYLKQLFASSSKIIVDVSVLASTSLKRKDFF